MLWLITGCARLALDPGEPLPQHLSDLALDRARDVVSFEPSWPLWSDGLTKDRLVWLPPGERIGEGWRWPEGSLLLKTFSAPDGVPVETRALYRVDGAWEYEVWLWDGDDAELLPLDETVDLGDHQVPSRFECRQCHDAGGGVLGFAALQLADPGAFRALFDEVPEPEPIAGHDPATTEVLGYFVGNCVHCHNGLPGDDHSFDLRPEVALDQLVDVPTDSSATAAGIRVVPGSPEDSILYLAMSGEHDDEEIRAMPPLAVVVRDEQGITSVHDWIGDL